MITTEAATFTYQQLLNGLKEMAGPFVDVMRFLTIAEMDWLINKS